MSSKSDVNTVETTDGGLDLFEQGIPGGSLGLGQLDLGIRGPQVAARGDQFPRRDQVSQHGLQQHRSQDLATGRGNGGAGQGPPGLPFFELLPDRLHHGSGQ